MALTANSVQTPIRPASALTGGSEGSPFHMQGYLTASVSYPVGQVLINTSGLLTQAGFAAGILAASVTAGVVDEVAPRRQDMAPLTTGALPAAALPRQRTTPAGTADFTNPDDQNFGISYAAFLPGMNFAAHNVLVAGNGTDVRAVAATDIMATGSYGITITAGAANAQVNYATKANLTVLLQGSTAAQRVWAYVNPQLTTAISNVFTNTPANIVLGATGTFNPVCLFVPINSLWF